MADTFKNPYNYTSPIGAALADLTRAVISGPSRAEKITAAENMLKIKRANESMLALQNQLGAFGTPDFNLPAAAAAAAGAGYSGLPDANLMLTADSAPSLTDESIGRAQLGAGGAFSGTNVGFQQDQTRQATQAANTLAETKRDNMATLAETGRQFDQKPYVAIGDDGMPQVFTNLTALGHRANVSETDMKGALLGENFANLADLGPEQQTVLGARGTGNPPRAKMYTMQDGTIGRTFDDTTDAVTGQPLPQDAVIGETSLTGGDFQDTELAKQRQELIARRQSVEGLIGQVNELDQMLAAPGAGASVGIIGSAAGAINGLASQVEAGLQIAGIQSPPELRDVMTYQGTLRALGIDNAQIQSALIDLAYSVADSREGGQKSVSDVDNALRTIGASLGDPVAMRTVLRKAAERAVTGYGAAARILSQVYGDKLKLPPVQFSPVVNGTIGESPPGPVVGQPAPAAAPADGIPTVATPEEAAALPPGTKFRTPDGRVKVRP